MKKTEHKVGSKDEKKYFRVMPLRGPPKLFFDNEDEYNKWTDCNKATSKRVNY